MLKGLEPRIRLPRLGVIGLGVKVIDGEKEYAKEVPNFVLPDDLRAKLGDVPTKLAVLFPSDDLDRIFQADYEVRKGRTVTMKCDGETARSLESQQAFPCKKPGTYDRCPLKCRARAHLNVIIPEGGIGVYWVGMGGEQRIADVLSELRTYKSTFGRLTNIVFELERVPTQEQYRTDRGEVRWRQGYPVHIRCAIAAEQALRLRGTDVREMPGAGVLREMLPSPEEDEEVAPAEEEHAGVEESAAVGVGDAGRIPPPLIGPQGGAPSGQDADGSRREAAPPNAHAPGGLEGEWDVSMSYRAAKQAGFPPETYAVYLKDVYGRDVDNLTPQDIADEARAWQQAGESALAMQTRKSIIVARLKRVSAGQGRLL